jgi:hypothetical protein
MVFLMMASVIASRRASMMMLAVIVSMRMASMVIVSKSGHATDRDDADQMAEKDQVVMTQIKYRAESKL